MDPFGWLHEQAAAGTDGCGSPRRSSRGRRAWAWPGPWRRSPWPSWPPPPARSPRRPGTSTGSSPGTASPRRMEAALLTPPGPALRRRASSRIFWSVSPWASALELNPLCVACALKGRRHWLVKWLAWRALQMETWLLWYATSYPYT